MRLKFNPNAKMTNQLMHKAVDRYWLNYLGDYSFVVGGMSAYS